MKDKIKSYIFILVLSIIVCIPLFQSNFNIYYDDGIQHICRLMGTYQSIEEGQVFPVIMSKFCNNFGYSWNIFYSPITAYIPLLFKIFTNSFILCLKLFILLVTFFSGIAIYEFINKVTKNRYAGLLGAAIYIFAPYRLADMYTRIAIAELTSFIFIPMVFHGLYNIFSEEEINKKKSGILLGIGAIGLVLTHIIIAMYTAFFAFAYVLIHIKKLKDKTVFKKLIINLFFILCITSFYLAPMMEHRFNTQYEVFKPGRMEREETLISYKLDVLDLFYTGKKQLTTEIGLITIIGFLLSIFAVKKIDKRYAKLYLFSMFSAIISIIMTLKFFPFEKLPELLTMLQFSFRMLEFSSFFLAIIVAINYSVVIKKFNIKDVIVLSILLVLLAYPLKPKIKYRDDINENSLWPAVKVTQKTKRVHAGCASFEYLPSKAFENLDYIKIRENKTYILSGSCDILSEEKDGTDMVLEVVNTEKDTVLELPYIYYLGYNVSIKSNNYETQLETYESENGFIEVHLNQIEEGEIRVAYEGTSIMKISSIISILSFTSMIIYYVVIKRRNI